MLHRLRSHHEVCTGLAALALTACFYAPTGSVDGPGDASTGAPGLTSTGGVEPQTDTGDGDDTGPLDPTSGDTGTAVCGNALVEPGEQCDNGEANNGMNGSICRADCSQNVCGDGYVASNEGCDDGNSVDDDGCTNQCTSADCGDGEVQAPEQCDDGNAIEDDGCSSLCKLPFCGDGLMGRGEQCDHGVDNGDDKDCTLTCTIAYCGDGKVKAAAEECDDGNQEDGDACLNGCKFNICGDSIVGAGEECDQGPANSDLEGNGLCSTQCDRRAFWVFVSSMKFDLVDGFSSRSEADARCSSAAAMAGSTSNFRAWLGGPMTPATTGLHQSSVPYVKLDPAGNWYPLAVNYEDLLDGVLQAPIDRTEYGLEVKGMPCTQETAVWTGAKANGMSTGLHCMGWSNTAMDMVTVGSAVSSDSGWSESSCMLWNCSQATRLYCFEQP